MNVLLFTIGSVLGALAVALGAFGAHALRSRVTAERLAVFETGVRYHLIHALGLVLAGLTSAWLPASSWVTACGWLWIAGIVLFSGSLYLLVLTDRRTWAMFTPFGGVLLILGWLCLAIAPFL